MLNLLAQAAGEKIKNPLLPSTGSYSGAISFLNSFLPALVTLIFIVGVVIFFFILITAAIQWIASGGDKQAVETAKGKLTHALIGLILLFSAFAIIKLLEDFFGISILTIDIGSLIIQ